jgi:hypothetical protein
MVVGTIEGDAAVAMGVGEEFDVGTGQGAAAFKSVSVLVRFRSVFREEKRGLMKR